MNSFLVGMNFLRECPLLSLRDQLMSVLEEVFRDLCNFLVLSSDDIKQKGKKYISEVKTASKNGDMKAAAVASENNQLYEENMDKVYAAKIIDDVIPHCLECFQIIFAPTSSPSPGDHWLVNRSVEQFASDVRSVEVVCRKLLVSGSLVQPANARTATAKQIHPTMKTDRPAAIGDT
jgi:hypothetical protein